MKDQRLTAHHLQLRTRGVACSGFAECVARVVGDLIGTNDERLGKSRRYVFGFGDRQTQCRGDRFFAGTDRFIGFRVRTFEGKPKPLKQCGAIG